MLNIDGVQIKFFKDDIMVYNFSDVDIGVIYMNVDKSWGGYVTNLKPGFFSVSSPKKWEINPTDDPIIEIRFNHKHEFVKFDKKLNEFRLLTENIDFRPELDPIIISGVQGGGTSVVTKLLRFKGMFSGVDSGDINIRKTHESMFFRGINLVLRNGYNDDSYVKKLIYDGPNKLYFGDNFDKEQVWGFKIFIDETSLIWSRVYPNAKFISVVRGNKNSKHKTAEGEKFKKMSENEVKNKQFFKLEGNRIFHLDYDKLFKDFEYVNKVLTFCGLDIINNELEFKRLLLQIGYELH